MGVSILIAKAKTRARAKAKQASLSHTEALVSRLVDFKVGNLTLPTANDGKDGRNGQDAPSMEEILKELTPLLPESSHTTVEQQVDFGDIEEFVKGLLPEEDKELRPAVEKLIVESGEEVDLEGYVTQKELDEALLRIQRAIQESSGGGGGVMSDLANVIEVSTDTTITAQQLLANRINVILVTVAGITLTLPEADITKILFVQQGYTGTGTFTVCKI